jgi:hypothetical protein
VLDKRGEIIDVAMRWAVGADTLSFNSSNSITLNLNESSRGLWLSVRSLARAKCVSELECKGSYYGFDKNGALANLTDLFSTIARDVDDWHIMGCSSIGLSKRECR